MLICSCIDKEHDIRNCCFHWAAEIGTGTCAWSLLVLCVFYDRRVRIFMLKIRVFMYLVFICKTWVFIDIEDMGVH